MSKKSNVNPDHYKTAGRSRQGKDIVQEIQTQKYAQSRQAATVHDPDAAAKVYYERKGNAAYRKSAKKPDLTTQNCLRVRELPSGH
jgi:hypothetical protein